MLKAKDKMISKILLSGKFGFPLLGPPVCYTVYSPLFQAARAIRIWSLRCIIKDLVRCASGNVFVTPCIVFNPLFQTARAIRICSLRCIYKQNGSKDPMMSKKSHFWKISDSHFLLHPVLSPFSMLSGFAH